MSPKGLALALLLTLFVRDAQAFQTQVHVRSGMLSGNYNGLFSGSFQLLGAFDMDIEFFLAPTGSMYFRFIQGYDTPDSRPYYTSASLGGRYYFWGRGAPNLQKSVGLSIESRPTIRAYVGGDLGVAQVIVKSFGPTVQAVANMVDFGGNVGAIYQITNRFGLEGHFGLNYGYGMSSVNATGHSQRLMLGLTYQF